MNRKIILTDNLRFLKSHLGNAKNDISHLVLEENNKSNLFREYLLTLPNATEVMCRDIICEEKFIRQYSKFIYNLNIHNASKDWWTMNFTNNYPLLSPLCKNIFEFLTIKQLIETKPNDNIVVFLSNPFLTRFINDWLKRDSVSVSTNLSFKLNIKSALYAVPTFAIFFIFLKLLLRMLASRFLFLSLLSSAKIDYIIITHFMSHSFKKDGSFHNVFFGRLGEFINKENKTFITCGFLACTFKDILRGRRSQNNGAYPLEYFLSVIGLFKCLKHSLFAYLKRLPIKGEANIDEQDVLWLVKKEIDNAFNSGQVFINFFVYYSVKDILKKIDTDKILYPFENRSWEKLILLAARETQKDIRLTGYHHASLYPKHINFILEKDEIIKIPFPDELITIGRVTKILLENVFNFPSDFVKVGCALRQDKSFVAKDDYKTETNGFTLCIALASSLDEYVRTLRFLDNTLLDASYTIKIRPHPGIDFNKALTIYKPSRLKFLIDTNKKLTESLKDSNVVVYASSTVSIEALSMGKPLIYIDFGNFINSDPLFNFTEFKWTCKNPRDLPAILDEINSLDKDILKTKQQQGILYAKEYFYPVNSETIRPFLKK